MKRLLLLFPIMFAIGALMALTPDERVVVQRAQTQLRQGKADYAAAKSALVSADQKAIDAQTHADATDIANVQLTKDVKAFSDKAEDIAKERDKMLPVYKECTKWMGIGAIIFGVKDLLKHLMWFAIGGVVLIIAVYALSFAFPIFGVILAVVVRFFTFIFHGLNTALRALEAHLKPTPTP